MNFGALFLYHKKMPLFYCFVFIVLLHPPVFTVSTHKLFQEPEVLLEPLGLHPNTAKSTCITFLLSSLNFVLHFTHKATSHTVAAWKELTEMDSKKVFSVDFWGPFSSKGRSETVT